MTWEEVLPAHFRWSPKTYSPIPASITFNFEIGSSDLVLNSYSFTSSQCDGSPVTVLESESGIGLDAEVECMTVCSSSSGGGSSGDDDDNNTATIIMIVLVVGGVALIACCVAALFLLGGKRRKGDKEVQPEANRLVSVWYYAIRTAEK